MPTTTHRSRTALVRDLCDGERFSTDGGNTWHTCCTPLLDDVAVYDRGQRIGNANATTHRITIPTGTQVLVRPLRAKLATYTLTVTILHHGTVSQTTVEAAFAQPFVGELESVAVKDNGYTMVATIKLTTFQTPGRARQHVRDKLSTLPAVVFGAHMSADAADFGVYCDRRGDGCMKLGGHRGACFSGRYARIYSLEVTVGPQAALAAASLGEDQLKEFIAAYLTEFGSHIFSGVARADEQMGNGLVSLMFDAHEDPQIARQRIAALMTGFPVPYLAATLAYDVADVCSDVRIDLFTGEVAQ